ncbi:hypothetical protein D3C77_571460 [compost metagenome]
MLVTPKLSPSVLACAVELHVPSVENNTLPAWNIKYPSSPNGVIKPASLTFLISSMTLRISGVSTVGLPSFCTSPPTF